MRILIKTTVPKTVEQIKQEFDLKLFKALKPPLVNLDVTRFDGCEKGDQVHLLISFGPLKQKWVSHITEDGQNHFEWFFIDEGHLLPPPIKVWKHRHIVQKVNESRSVIKDDINFSCGNFMLDAVIYPLMYIQFWLRKPVYKKYFS